MASNGLVANPTKTVFMMLNDLGQDDLQKIITLEEEQAMITLQKMAFFIACMVYV